METKTKHYLIYAGIGGAVIIGGIYVYTVYFSNSGTNASASAPAASTNYPSAPSFAYLASGSGEMGNTSAVPEVSSTSILAGSGGGSGSSTMSNLLSQNQSLTNTLTGAVSSAPVNQIYNGNGGDIINPLITTTNVNYTPVTTLPNFPIMSIPIIAPSQILSSPS